jgi:hypothetical protein
VDIDAGGLLVAIWICGSAYFKVRLQLVEGHLHDDGERAATAMAGALTEMF